MANRIKTNSIFLLNALGTIFVMINYRDDS